MDGYGDSTYGDAFADVYDEWYEGISDIATTTAALLALAGDGPVLELGVGTGRLAVPLATAGAAFDLSVRGLDTSPAMLARLADRDPDGLVEPILASMADPPPGGPYSLVFAAYNTLFNLTTDELQAACFRAVAGALRPGGRFVVEAFVPDDTGERTSDVSVRSLTADRVVLSVSVREPAHQRAEGQFVELTEAGGVRLRPWSIRYATPEQLDAMAGAAGLTVEHRWADFARDAYDESAERHVTVYRNQVGNDGSPAG